MALWRRLVPALAWSAGLYAQKPENVLIVVNQASALAKTIGEYYATRREVPVRNICRVSSSTAETISFDEFDKHIAAAVKSCLVSRKLTESILYIVTTAGVPLRIDGSGDGMTTDRASVDSELTLLYSDIHGRKHMLLGPLRNPFFARSGAAFKHPDLPIYLVTRLAGYDFEDAKGLVDRALAAKNTGYFVIDLKANDSTQGNEWLRAAARQLPKDRSIVDETAKVLLNQRHVIGYAGWGSNDPDHKERHLGFQWLPGAIATEFVSSDGRTFARPPEQWTLGNWNDQKTWFAGTPQSMTADFIHDGATGASGHVYEPFLQFTPRPDLLLPAYYHGRTLAESYYLAIPALSWQNIVIGDPLCSLGKP